jgi:hypothetical protein
MFAGLVNYLPNDVTIQVEATGDSIDSSTGALVGSWSAAPSAALTGVGGANYSAVSGGLIKWGSSTYLSGRRLRGHTYLVPMADAMYDTTGELNSGTITGIDAILATFVGYFPGAVMLWQRPRPAAAAYTDRRGTVHPAIVARGGGFGPIDSGICRGLVTMLRSRRD